MATPLLTDRTEYHPIWHEAAQQTMIAFANDMGGVLVIGASDSGETLGCVFDEVVAVVNAFANDNVSPSMAGLVRIEKDVQDNRTLSRIYVAPGTELPYRFKGKVFHEGGVFIRAGNQTVAADLDEVFALIRRGDPRQWESAVSPTQELTFVAAQWVCETHGVPFAPEAFGIVNAQGQYTRLGYLLSDQNSHATVLTRVDAQGKFKDSRRLEKSLLSQMQRLMQEFSDINSPYINKDTGKQEREAIYPWPAIAVREALANTLAHRDYSSALDACITVSPRNIRFSTLGGLPPELPAKQLLKIGTTFCRNQRLAQLFQKLGWMEIAGNGMPAIARAYAGCHISPTLEAQTRFFLIDLPRVYAPQITRTETVMAYLRDSIEGRTHIELEAHLGVSRPTITKVLQELEDAGRIVRQGNARSTRYFAK
ncbi:MAG: putative DNA binding domain-containing protein [Sutterellaceae bacterium]|nr:putative DNA binding domain-containing protein [Sutterellaceae bacterium]